MADGSIRSATASSPSPRMGITVYGCEPDEAEMLRAVAPRFGVTPMIVETALSEANVASALGSRCISVDHKTPIGKSTLRALSHVGVRYLSTRSVGCNHIPVEYANSVGIDVENVSYSPDSVADYTLLLMLLLLRNAKAVLLRAEAHDYRLNEIRGKELRDLTVGVVGTGRIGAASAYLLRLQQLPNVIISPHTAYYTDHALSDIVESTVRNCLQFERDRVAWTN
jgi:D-specific alpha-keto acid dehydrogenase